MSARDPRRQAEAQVLGSPRWRNEPRIWRHVVGSGEQAGQVDWDAVLAETWSGGERVLVAALASLAHPERRVSLNEIVTRLDDDNFERLLAAVRQLRRALR